MLRLDATLAVPSFNSCGSLRLFEGIITPDFSLFPEMPKAQRIWNCYMSRVMGISKNLCWFLEIPVQYFHKLL